MPIAMLSGGAIGAVANYFAARSAAKSMQDQTNQIRKQYEDAARVSRGMAAKTDQQSKASYQWASSMLRKFSENPQVAAGINESLNGRLVDMGNRSDKFYTDAATMLASRPAKISNSAVKAEALKGAISGGLSGLGLMSEIGSTTGGKESLDAVDGVVKAGAGNGFGVIAKLATTASNALSQWMHTRKQQPFEFDPWNIIPENPWQKM